MAEENKGEMDRPKPAHPGPKTSQVPTVSRTVLVRMNDGTDRPMVIVKVLNPNLVDGVITLNGWNDRSLAVPGVREGSLHSWVTSIERGNGTGQWRFHNE